MNNIIDIGKNQKFRRFQEKPPRPEEKQDPLLQQQQTFEIPECAICCEKMIQDLAVLIPCGHIFHQKCIQIYSQLKCPICRKQNIQSIPIHFQIELNINKSQQFQQNKLKQNQQFDQQKNQNQESMENRLWELITKGKKQFDHLYSQKNFQKQNNQNEIQILKSFESVSKELSNLFRDITSQIESQGYSNNQISKNSTSIQRTKQQTQIQISEKELQPYTSDTQIENWKNVIDIGENKNCNLRYCNGTQSYQDKYPYRSNSYNKKEQKQYQ